MEIGIMGSGEIVSGMLAMMQQTGTFHCTSLFCRKQSHERGAALAEKYEIAGLYHDQEAFFADAKYDTVYIAVINSEHYTYTKDALLHGKNVICEKPFTSTYEQTCELKRIAEKRGLFLYEMKRSVMTENYGLIRNGLAEIGKPVLASFRLCHRSRRYDQYLAGKIAPVFDPACDGGALYDLGVYAVHFIIGLFGMPVSALYDHTDGYNGVDLEGMLEIGYPDLHCIGMLSKTKSERPGFMIMGDKGFLYSESSVMLPGKTVFVSNSGEQKIICEDRKDSWLDELHAIERMFRERDDVLCGSQLEQTLACMKVIEYAGKRGGL